jgi:hypothetical protein
MAAVKHLVARLLSSGQAVLIGTASRLLGLSNPIRATMWVSVFCELGRIAPKRESIPILRGLGMVEVTPVTEGSPSDNHILCLNQPRERTHVRARWGPPLKGSGKRCRAVIWGLSSWVQNP